MPTKLVLGFFWSLRRSHCVIVVMFLAKQMREAHHKPVNDWKGTYTRVTVVQRNLMARIEKCRMKKTNYFWMKKEKWSNFFQFNRPLANSKCTLFYKGHETKHWTVWAILNVSVLNSDEKKIRSQADFLFLFIHELHQLVGFLSHWTFYILTIFIQSYPNIGCSYQEGRLCINCPLTHRLQIKIKEKISKTEKS